MSSRDSEPNPVDKVRQDKKSSAAPDAGAATAPAQVEKPGKTDLKPVSDKRPTRQPPYNVVLLDDDEHTYEYVIDMLQKVFHMPRERGFQVAKEVDSNKRAILLTTTLEHAELKQEQVHGFGPDKLIAGCKGAMTVVLEPVAS
jgi:ATP-dependent Clp protease adaptor protein ClpS